jgi:solute carrier family 25 (adenine nucleotide translocator) protein 4/5/6/31
MSGTAATLSKTANAPLERVKLILQSQDSHPLIRKNPELRFTGIVNCLTRIFNDDGILALWRGNLANI